MLRRERPVGPAQPAGAERRSRPDGREARIGDREAAIRFAASIIWRGALAIQVVVVVLACCGTALSRAGPLATSAVDVRPLTWAPPVCGDDTHGCVDLYLSNTGSNQTPSLSASNDYRIHLPNVPLQGGLQIRGGRNVIIIGGQINLTVPCSDASSACHGINISKPTSGHVFIEGVWIHNPQSPIAQSTGDGIDVDDPAGQPSDITLQNIRIDGISGCSGGADHADVFQPYSVPGARIHIDHLTGTTDCQGMMLDPDLGWNAFGQLAVEYVIKNVNINVLDNPHDDVDANRYAWWLTGGSAQDGCLSGPISISNVYAQQPDGTLKVNSVWPDSDQPAACRSLWTTPTLAFPNSPQIRGVVTAGTPPNGDYVPEATAGPDYVSPGYATLTWAPPVCGDDTHGCVDLYLSNTGSNQTPSLSASNDYRIHLPSVPLQGGLQIRGGRNVIIIGGQINLTVPCSDASSACHGINISKPTSGHVFIEGVWIHNPQSPIAQSTGDGIDVDDPAGQPSDITLQNIRIDGISGCSGGADHADVFQPYSVPGARIHIDHLTGTTDCQGMMLDPDLGWNAFGQLAVEYVIKNVNINVLDNPHDDVDANRYAWWLTGGSAQDGCLSGPISISNVYAQQPDGTLKVNSVWPDSDQPAACRSLWTTPTLAFPNSPQIRGVVTAGTPPNGDYVPEATAGPDYVSPGYH